MEAIMDEACGMATNEQAGWKKRKTPNLAISHEASTASSTPVASSRSSRNRQAGTRGPGAQGQRQITHLEDVITMMAWGNPDKKAKSGSITMRCKFCGYSSRQKIGNNNWQRCAEAGCAKQQEKRRWISTPVGLLKTRSSFWVCHFIT